MQKIMIHEIYGKPLYLKSVLYRNYTDEEDIHDFFNEKMNEIFIESNTKRYNTRKDYKELSDAFEFMDCKHLFTYKFIYPNLI